MEESVFCCKDGRVIRIQVDQEEDFTTTISDSDGRKIGRFEFRRIEDVNNEYLKLCWAYVDLVDSSYRRQGIGRECLKQVRELSGLPIVTADNDGMLQDDGSHLTADAPRFVARMQVERLIADADRQEAD
jgi:GNAT superfamily N-acetyltransferase